MLSAARSGIMGCRGLVVAAAGEVASAGKVPGSAQRSKGDGSELL